MGRASAKTTQARTSRHAREHTLQEELAAARRKRRGAVIIEKLAALCELAPKEPRYAHQLGDAYRAVGRTERAAEVYATAARIYADRGQLARAEAMAQTLREVAPTRDDLQAGIRESLGVTPKRARVITQPGARSLSLLELARTEAKTQVAADEAAANEAPKTVHPTRARRKTPTQRLPPMAVQELARIARARHSLTDVEPPATPGETRPDAGVPPPPPQRSATQGTTDEPRPVAANGHLDARSAAQAQLERFELFRRLPPELLGILAEHVEQRHFNSGTHVIRHGEAANGCYFVVEGAARVYVPGRRGSKDITLKRGQIFGESCLLDEAKRVADVVAYGNLLAIFIPRSLMTRLARIAPRFYELLFATLTKRLVANLLMSSELFSAFDLESRLEISRFFRLRRAAPAALLYGGELARGVCIPLSGWATLIANESQGQAAPLRIGPGQAVGQEQLLGLAMLPYELRAETDLVYLELPVAEGPELARRFPALLTKLGQLLATPELML